MKIVAALLAALALAAPVQASVSPDWKRRALATAQHVWHPPCTMTLAFGDPADAEIVTDDGERTLLADEWVGEGCTININRSSGWLGYPHFCTVVLHGGGHVAGMGHSDRGIMRAERQVGLTIGRVDGRRVTIWTGVDRRCLRLRDHQVPGRVGQRRGDRV